MKSDERVPEKCDVAIVGGGIAGCAVAYHLSKLGQTNVCVLEKNTLTSGTTWHAEGLVIAMRSTGAATKIYRDSIETYLAAQHESGQDIGWRKIGCMNIFKDHERRLDFVDQATAFRSLGGDVSFLSPSEAHDFNPHMRTDDILGAVYSPEGYKANPSDLTAAIAKAARLNGVRFLENCTVETLAFYENGPRREIRGVQTDRGELLCDQLVLACGVWTRDLARSYGFDLPIQGLIRSYMITNPIEGAMESFPISMDFDGFHYSAPEVGGMLIGLQEPTVKPASAALIADLPAFASLPEDWDHLGAAIEMACHRYPALESAGIKTVFTGVEGYTPDGRPVIGPVPGTDGVWSFAGFNGTGIGQCGGIGKALANWVVSGVSGLDLSSMDPRRFPAVFNRDDVLESRTSGLPYFFTGVNMPGREFGSARNLIRSPFHDELKSHGAHFGQAMGFEYPRYFVPAASGLVEFDPTFGRPGWIDVVADEHRATREAVSLSERSHMTKVIVEGDGAAAMLERLCTNAINEYAGKVCHSAMLDRQGRYVSDLTIARLADDRFFLVSSADQRNFLLDHLNRYAPRNSRLRIRDVTEEMAGLAVHGPLSQQLCAELWEKKFSRSAFPYLTAKTWREGPSTLICMGISGIGEIGWEFYLPMDGALATFRRFMEAGPGFGLALAGSYAMDSVRMEKGIGVFGRDFGRSVGPHEAGRMDEVSIDRPIEFEGRKALLAKIDQDLGQERLTFLADPTEIDNSAWPHGGEPIYRDGEYVGSISSISYGHSVGKLIAFGHISLRKPAEDERSITESEFGISIDGRPVQLTPCFEPLNDAGVASGRL